MQRYTKVYIIDYSLHKCARAMHDLIIDYSLRLKQMLDDLV
jgi:hypothetical protein